MLKKVIVQAASTENSDLLCTRVGNEIETTTTVSPETPAGAE